MAGADLVVGVGVDARRDAKQHRLHAAGRGRQPLDLVELAAVVEHHQPARRRRSPSARSASDLLLPWTITDAGIGAGPQRRGQLAGRGDVGAQPLPASRRDHRHRGVGLAGVHRPRRSRVALQPGQVGPRRGPAARARRQTYSGVPNSAASADAATPPSAARSQRGDRCAGLAPAARAGCPAPAGRPRPARRGRLGEPLAGRHPLRHRECASRKGTPSRTSCSARSVATVRPSPRRRPPSARGRTAARARTPSAPRSAPARSST